ncbi:dipeptidase [Pontibacter vulgaris]|uniref:dipeptidase n=1 Tax=Pontibacter vulgaris TaxID=2905679 RepID=UPI001FA7C3AE|nr:membrane dipeptidase [Pontibacter vulgaris]
MNQTKPAAFPIIDMHCDLLSYLADVPGASMDKLEDIGCAEPALKQGNVKLQVMAIYSAVEPGSSAYGLLQSEVFKKLAEGSNECFMAVTDNETLHQAMQGRATGMVAAIENASGFCEEDDTLEDGFKKLEKIIENTGRVLYISFTHQYANRFGGGNMTTSGITTEGKMLLDYLHGRRIAVDFSHTSDALAFDILNHIDAEKLDIPILASHSNFRPVWDHNRNLPDELTQEIVLREGLIGINFLRHFLNATEPDALLQHILYGFSHGAENSICFGADYFYTAGDPDPSRYPYYFKEYEHAGNSYTYILAKLQEQLSQQQLEKLSYGNAQRFLQKLWAV